MSAVKPLDRKRFSHYRTQNASVKSKIGREPRHFFFPHIVTFSLYLCCPHLYVRMSLHMFTCYCVCSHRIRGLPTQIVIVRKSRSREKKET